MGELNWSGRVFTLNWVAAQDNWTQGTSELICVSKLLNDAAHASRWALWDWRGFGLSKHCLRAEGVEIEWLKVRIWKMPFRPIRQKVKPLPLPKVANLFCRPSNSNANKGLLTYYLLKKIMQETCHKYTFCWLAHFVLNSYKFITSFSSNKGVLNRKVKDVRGRCSGPSTTHLSGIWFARVMDG